MLSGRGQGQPMMLWSLLVLSLLPLVNAQCARIELPTAELVDGASYTLTVPENQNVTIPFTLNTDDCHKDQAVTITVSKLHQENSVYEDFCKWRVQGDNAFSFRDENCRAEGRGAYSLTKRVDRSDATWWTWRVTYGGSISSSFVRFHVTYPPKITQFSTSPPSEVVKPGSSVNLVCSYEKGNPDVAPFFRDAEGELLDVHRESPGEVTHMIHDVSCDDTGSFSCEAAGAAENKTRMLLVQCPPHFRQDTGTGKQFVVTADQPAQLKFQIRSHTAVLSACWLSPWLGGGGSSPSPSAMEKRKDNCLSHIKTLGNPPDMTLTLRLSMTSDYLGTWQLTIHNDAGSGDVIFGIEFPAVSSTVSSTPEPTTVVLLDGTSQSTTRGTFPLSESSVVPLELTTRSTQRSSTKGPTAGAQSARNDCRWLIGALVCAWLPVKTAGFA